MRNGGSLRVGPKFKGRSTVKWGIGGLPVKTGDLKVKGDADTQVIKKTIYLYIYKLNNCMLYRVNSRDIVILNFENIFFDFTFYKAFVVWYKL